MRQAQLVREIIKSLEEIRDTAGLRSLEVFNDWVTLTYHTLRMLPFHADSVFRTGRLATDDEQTQAAFRDIERRYAQPPPAVFARSFALVLRLADLDPYIDPFGTVYEDLELGSFHRGQFFTPRDLCLTMARAYVSDIEETVRGRLKEALLTIPLYAIGDLMGATTTDATLELLYVENREEIEYEPITVYDPAVGSGRTLLAVAEILPDWMVRRGLVRFYGQDVDGTCVMMAKSNMMLYGLNGLGIYLTSENALPIEPDYSGEPGEQLILI